VAAAGRRRYSDLKRISPGETGIPTFEALAEWLWLKAEWVGGKFLQVYLLKGFVDSLFLK
jgi:hypothetical protein